MKTLYPILVNQINHMWIAEAECPYSIKGFFLRGPRDLLFGLMTQFMLK